MGHNNQKKIAAINDYTGFGRCSIAVELPVISALKVQCCPLPTSVLSNHTGFDSFYFEDFTDSMPAYIAEWKKLNLKFDGICSGFLGSHRQIKIVEDFFKTFKTDENIILVDPVMGDYGKLYSTYTTQTCTEMKKLVKYADILTPNLTEACILTDEEYDEKRDVAFWKEPEEMCQSILTTGSYAVLPPSIAHKPQMRAGKEACHVKKCVAKVKWQA